VPHPTWTAPDLTPDDLIACAALCRDTLAPVRDRDWSLPAGDLEWSCRYAIDHVADALLIYAGHLATRAPSRRPRPRTGDPARSPADLLSVVETAAAILAAVVRAAPPGARGFHGSGMADATGYLGMAGTEILIHTDDIAAGFGIPFAGSDDLAAKIVARIFPWTPAGVPAWAALRWSAGRAALPGHPRQDEHWDWHCAPLAEWDGASQPTAPLG